MSVHACVAERPSNDMAGEEGSSERMASRARATIPTTAGWNCSVCTFTNSPSAFKCAMCDVRKGTSTRKSRVSDDILAGQQSLSYVAKITPSKRLPEVESRPKPKLPHSQHVSHLSHQHKSVKRPSHASEESMSKTSVQAIAERQMKALYASHTGRRLANDTRIQKKRQRRLSQLKNIDRSTGVTMLVTVGALTVHITEFQPLHTAAHSINAMDTAENASPAKTHQTEGTGVTDTTGTEGTSNNRSTLSGGE